MLKVNYFEPEQFQDCIERIWIAENDNEEKKIVVPPNQFIDMLFPLSENGFYSNGLHLKTTCVEGIMFKPILFKLLPYTKLMGIRLYGNGLYPFAAIKGKDILNKNISFKVEKKHQELIDQIIKLKDNNSILETTYKLLDQMYDPKREKKIKLLKEFYFNMRSNQDSMNIEAFCKQMGTNYTSLNRIFKEILGTSTKKIERLIKLRKSLQRLLDTPEKLSQIGIDSGYFDQSHFIKEFKLHMGMSPSEYLSLLKNSKVFGILRNLDMSAI